MRRTLACGGITLVLIAAATWVLPVALSGDAAVIHTTRVTNDGSTKTENETVGWASIRSDQLVIVLLGGGLVLLILGAVPGPIKKVVTPVGVFEFDSEALAEVAGRTVAKVPGGQTVPVETFEEVFSDAVDHLGEVAPRRPARTFRPSKSQIDEAVERALEQRD